MENLQQSDFQCEKLLFPSELMGRYIKIIHWFREENESELTHYC